MPPSGGPRKGAGRKPADPKGVVRVQISVLLHPKTLKKIDKKARGRSRGQVIDEAFE